jgi:hypothetical protein
VPDAAMAELCNEVERSKVIAGGVTTANFPQVAKNLRRSSSASWEGVGISVIALALSEHDKDPRISHSRKAKAPVADGSSAHELQVCQFGLRPLIPWVTSK